MELHDLREAERHVVEGERHIAEQEARLAEIDRDGHDTTQARRLLDNFRAVQTQHVAHRDFILKRLQE